MTLSNCFNLPSPMAQTTSYEHRLAIGTVDTSHSLGIKCSPSPITRSIPLNTNHVNQYASMRNNTTNDPIDGDTNAPHQHCASLLTLYLSLASLRVDSLFLILLMELLTLSIHRCKENHNGNVSCSEATNIRVPLSDVADAIWRGNAIVGTDGSAANDHGTYSFVILTDTHTDSPQLAVRCGRKSSYACRVYRHGLPPPRRSSPVCLPLFCQTTSNPVSSWTSHRGHPKIALCTGQQECSRRRPQVALRHRNLRF